MRSGRVISLADWHTCQLTSRRCSRRTLIVEIAGAINGADDVYFIGRGLDHAIAMEGSLKLKEISYIHSEAMPAGELKHGTLALITEDVR